MAIASVANRISSTSTNAPVLEIIAGTNFGYKLLEMGLTPSGTTGALTIISLGYPQAKGITPTSPVTLICEDQNNTTTINTQTALAWGTAPTVPSAFLDRKTFGAPPASQSNGYIWTFPRGLIVSKNNSFVLWNHVGNSGAPPDVWCVVEE